MMVIAMLSNNVPFPAPSAAPTGINISNVTNSSITVHWEPVDCIHRNGDITGYSILYGVHRSGSTQTIQVSGCATTVTITSGLTSSTNYSVEVAAVNIAGIGMYSTSLIVTTKGITFIKYLFIYLIAVYHYWSK